MLREIRSKTNEGIGSERRSGSVHKRVPRQRRTRMKTPSRRVRDVPVSSPQTWSLISPEPEVENTVDWVVTDENFVDTVISPSAPTRASSPLRCSASAKKLRDFSGILDSLVVSSDDEDGEEEEEVVEKAREEKVAHVGSDSHAITPFAVEKDDAKVEFSWNWEAWWVKAVCVFAALCIFWRMIGSRSSSGGVEDIWGENGVSSRGGSVPQLRMLVEGEAGSGGRRYGPSRAVGMLLVGPLEDSGEYAVWTDLRWTPSLHPRFSRLCVTATAVTEGAGVARHAVHCLQASDTRALLGQQALAWEDRPLSNPIHPSGPSSPLPGWFRIDGTIPGESYVITAVVMDSRGKKHTRTVSFTADKLDTNNNHDPPLIAGPTTATTEPRLQVQFDTPKQEWQAVEHAKDTKKAIAAFLPKM